MCLGVWWVRVRCVQQRSEREAGSGSWGFILHVPEALKTLETAQDITSPSESAQVYSLVTSLRVLRPFSYLSQLFPPGLGLEYARNSLVSLSAEASHR